MPVEFVDQPGEAPGVGGSDQNQPTRPVAEERVEVGDDILARIDAHLEELRANEVDVVRELAEARKSLSDSMVDQQRAVTPAAKESFTEQISTQQGRVRSLELALSSIHQDRERAQAEREERAIVAADQVAYCDNCARSNAWPWSSLKRQGRCMVCRAAPLDLNVRPRVDLPRYPVVAGEPGTENADGSVPFGTPVGLAS